MNLQSYSRFRSPNKRTCIGQVCSVSTQDSCVSQTVQHKSWSKTEFCEVVPLWKAWHRYRPNICSVQQLLCFNFGCGNFQKNIFHLINKQFCVLLGESFDDTIISRGLWPPHFSYVDLGFYYLWGMLNDKFYSNNSSTEEDIVSPFNRPKFDCNEQQVCYVWYKTVSWMKPFPARSLTVVKKNLDISCNTLN
jgi:hypothetical protein